MKYMFDDDLVVAKQDNKNMHANTHTAYTDLWHASRQPYPQRVDIFSIYLRFCSSDIFCFFFLWSCFVIIIKYIFGWP